ncbi:MAG: RNA polymerase sigma factor, partial [Spirochaetes bacterium]|nr:RNA polymerase sigma factor [Spirochaetota bacterium]
KKSAKIRRISQIRVPIPNPGNEINYEKKGKKMTVLQFLEVYIGSEEQADASEKNESKEKVLAFINGDEDAASYFFTKYSEHLYNFILKNIGDKDDALDILQDAFVRLLKSRTLVRVDKGIKSYLFTIVVNLCRDLYKKRGKQKMVSTDLLKESNVELPDTGYETSKNVELKEMEAFLEYCIDELPEREKTVVLLKKINGFTYKQITEVCGFNERTSRRIMQSALQKIVTMFESRGYARNGEILW